MNVMFLNSLPPNILAKYIFLYGLSVIFFFFQTEGRRWKILKKEKNQT